MEFAYTAEEQAILSARVAIANAVEVAERLKAVIGGREAALVVTKLEEADLWFSRIAPSRGCCEGETK